MSRTSTIQKILLVIFSLILVAVVLEIGLRIGGFVYLQVQDHANRQRMDARDTITVMCIGESTTAMGGESSYPSQLQKVLDEEIPERKFHVINKGIPMANTGIIKEKISGWAEEYQPQIAVIMMGINDHNDVIPIDLRSSLGLSWWKSMRLYKLYRWFQKNLIYRARPVEIDFPDRLSWLDTKKAVDKKIEIGKMIVKADEENDHMQARLAMVEIRALSEWVTDNEELYAAYGKLILKHQWHNDLPEVLQYFLKRNHRHTWLHDYAATSCRTPTVKRVITGYLKQRINARPDDWKLHEFLGTCLAMAGDTAEADEAFQRAQILQRQLIDPVTQQNYLDVLDVLSKKKIPFILVQYPMRDVASLKAMLADGIDVDQTVFVDNQESFQRGVERYGYDAYFMDRFGGNFGHCTPQGNLLLARNVAQAIGALVGK